MKQLNTQVDVNAPISQVWEALLDLSKYGEWNPFIYQVDGSCRLNEVVTVHMHISGKGFQQYRVKLTKIDEAAKAFYWLGHFHVRGLIDGDHRFELLRLPDGRTRVRQYELFRGILVPLVWNSYIVRHLLPCFEALNENLKAWCEHAPLPHALARP
ncbi:SRPBCC domain-containing protein [Paucibacter oligotrophus]|uniref:SRPBCC domain-containing protein n=2 Tax=Roseateles oligotrophus TaxID=1769250 RepID=A0ABT2YFB1_9BURK|nr:SRPBCC domain-containing protein [Roseateles oligotrophus]